MLAMKTGELFALACDLGAHLNAATTRERDALCGYGMALGTAYQIYDDCLDVFGTEGAAGKSLGTDLVKGKVTLPLIILLERQDAALNNKVESLIGDYQPERFPHVLALLKRHGAMHESLCAVESCLRPARDLAGQLRPCEAREGLIKLCDVLAAQSESLGGDA